MRFFSVVLLFFVVLNCSNVKNRSVNVSDIIQKEYSGNLLLSNKKFRPDWWKSFKIDELNELMDSLFKNNFDLKVAVLKVKEVELAYERDKAELFPKLNLNASYSRTETKNKGFPRSGSDLYKLGLSTNYEIDIWGKIRSGIKIEKLNYMEKVLTYDSVAITLSGELVKSYFSLIAGYEKREILKNEMGLLEEKLDLLKMKYKQGEVSIDAIYDVMQRLKSIETELENVKKNIRFSQFQINLLLGQNITHNIFQPKLRTLKVDYNILNVGFPAELLQNRPDIKAAEIKLIKSYESIKIARAERFPKLTLSADFNFNDKKVKNIFDNWIFNLAAGLIYPIFDYGQRKKNEEIARIQSEESFVEYKNTVLKGLKEVETAFAEIKKSKKIVDITKKQIDFANKKLEKIKDDYINGSGDFIKVIGEIQTLYEYKKSLVDAKLSFLLSVIDLYKAVGGKYYSNLPN